MSLYPAVPQSSVQKIPPQKWMPPKTVSLAMQVPSDDVVVELQMLRSDMSYPAPTAVAES